MDLWIKRRFKTKLSGHQARQDRKERMGSRGLSGEKERL